MLTKQSNAPVPLRFLFSGIHPERDVFTLAYCTESCSGQAADYRDMKRASFPPRVFCD